MGVYNSNEDAYMTTNNKQYGKPPPKGKNDNSVFERNMENKYNVTSNKNTGNEIDGKFIGKKQYERQKPDYNPFNNDLNTPNDDPKLPSVGKKQFDRQKAEFNPINYKNEANAQNEDLKFSVGKKQFDRPRSEFNPLNYEGNNVQIGSNAGKKQFAERQKGDFNVINGQINGVEEMMGGGGKRMNYPKGNADFNLISGQRQEEGKYISAKQEYHMDKKGEDMLKKRLMENANLINQFAGDFINFFIF